MKEKVRKAISIFSVLLLITVQISSVWAESTVFYGYGYGYSEEAKSPSPGDLLINEFVSNPETGDQEWIEVYNPGLFVLNLQDCQLEDKLGKIFQFEKEDFLEPLGFHHASLTKTKLNNSGDLIVLRCGDQVIDQLAYGDQSPGEKVKTVGYHEDQEYLPAPAKGQSLGRVPDGGQVWYELSSLSPAAPNTIINSPPQAQIDIQGSGKLEACDKLSFNVTGEKSSDPDGDRIDYIWEYQEISGKWLHSTDRKNPLSFTFIKEMGSQFEVQLKVTDPYGETSEASVFPRLGVCESLQKAEKPPNYQFSKNILINEVFPNPFGKDSEIEFIELINLGKEPVVLDGWKIEGSSKKSLQNFQIEAQGFLLLENITVRNSDGHFSLLDPHDHIQSSINYEKSEEGKSLSRNEFGRFLWTIPTPGQANDFPFQKEIVYLQADADVIITRFLPNPRGKDEGNEWIEITNRSKKIQDLSGWHLDNREGGSKPYQLQNISLLPGETKTFFSSETGITLRNTADQVRLLSPSQQIIDQLEWKTPAPDGFIFERNQLIRDLNIAPDEAKVLEVIDGDTIDVEINGVRERVRLIGVDTPETVHPFKPLEFFGKEASQFTKSQLEGKTVRLEYDLSKRGKYGRLLAYVWLGDRHFNAELIEKGYAFAYLKYPFKYREAFRLLEKHAREAGRGLWASQEIQVIREEQEKVIDEETEELESIAEVLEELEEEIIEEDQEEAQKQEWDTSGWDQIHLNEMLPNPAGKDTDGGEYIELQFFGEGELELKGWQLLNNKGKILYQFEDEMIRKILLISPQKTIKNTEELIQLVDPLGTVQDEFRYNQSIKDDQVWSRHPLTQSWQLLNEGSPELPNSILFLSFENDRDGDGLDDDIEKRYGYGSTNIDSKENNFPDDFELLKQHQFFSEYEEYLRQSFSVQAKQTKRTLTFSGLSRPYTQVILEILPENAQVSIPVASDGTWNYKVDIGLEAGAHRFIFSLNDWKNRNFEKFEFFDLTLLNRLNARKLPKKSRAKKAQIKPLYKIFEIFQPWQKALLYKQGILFANGQKADLSQVIERTAALLSTSSANLQYQGQQTAPQWQLVPSAYANESNQKDQQEPLWLVFLLVVMLISVEIYSKHRKIP